MRLHHLGWVGAHVMFGSGCSCGVGVGVRLQDSSSRSSITFTPGTARRRSSVAGIPGREKRGASRRCLRRDRDTARVGRPPAGLRCSPTSSAAIDSFDELHRGASHGRLNQKGPLIPSIRSRPAAPARCRLAVGRERAPERPRTSPRRRCAPGVAPRSPSERPALLRRFLTLCNVAGSLEARARRPGRNACEGWCGAAQALARARPRDDTWQGPPVDF